MIVATRLPMDLKNEQPTPACPHDPPGSSGNDPPHPSAGAGFDCFHVAIDDAAQMASIGVPPDETRRSTMAFHVQGCAGSESQA